MATLRITSLYDSCWKLFGFQYDQCIADRDLYLAKLQRRLGHEIAADIQRHVDASLGRLLLIPDLRDPEIMTMKEFYALWGKEKTVEEVKRRIEFNAIFCDPIQEVLPTLGLSWRQDILRLLDGQISPGHLPLKNVKKFLAMVQAATQRIEGSAEDVRLFQRRRQELIAFLERVVKMGEPLWCEL